MNMFLTDQQTSYLRRIHANKKAIYYEFVGFSQKL